MSTLAPLLLPSTGQINNLQWSVDNTVPRHLGLPQIKMSQAYMIRNAAKNVGPREEIVENNKYYSLFIPLLDALL